MPDNDHPADRRVELRKYPNRRYYNTTHSRHVTLETIYSLVREGYDVTVTDSKTGEDITAQVLAQIILEHDTPKLRMFPVDLLHQVIRANEPLIRDFVDKYFNQALSAFLRSQRQFERYLRQSLGLYSPLHGQQEWARIMMAPFLPPFLSAPGNSPGNPDQATAEQNSHEPSEDLRKMIDQLQRQVADLEQRLSQPQSG